MSSLKLTAKAPENQWLEDDCVLFGARPMFRCELTVSFRECFFPMNFWLGKIQLPGAAGGSGSSGPWPPEIQGRWEVSCPRYRWHPQG